MVDDRAVEVRKLLAAVGSGNQEVWDTVDAAMSAPNHRSSAGAVVPAALSFAIVGMFSDKEIRTMTRAVAEALSRDRTAGAVVSVRAAQAYVRLALGEQQLGPAW